MKSDEQSRGGSSSSIQSLFALPRDVPVPKPAEVGSWGTSNRANEYQGGDFGHVDLSIFGSSKATDEVESTSATVEAGSTSETNTLPKQAVGRTVSPTLRLYSP